MSDPSNGNSDPPAETLEQRKQRLQDEIEQLDRLERERAAHERQQQQAARQAELPPEMQEQAAELERRAEEELDRDYPQAWKPAKPEDGHPQQLVGMIERIEPSVGPSPVYETYSAVIELTTTTRERWSVWAEHHGVIYKSMLRLRLQPGDVIAIRHEGMRQSKQSGFDYRDFKVRRLTGDSNEPQRVDYDQLAREAGDQAALPAPAAAVDEADDDIPF